MRDRGLDPEAFDTSCKCKGKGNEATEKYVNIFLRNMSQKIPNDLNMRLWPKQSSAHKCTGNEASTN